MDCFYGNFIDYEVVRFVLVCPCLFLLMILGNGVKQCYVMSPNDWVYVLLGLKSDKSD